MENIRKYYSGKYAEWMSRVREKVSNSDYEFAYQPLELAYPYLKRLSNIYSERIPDLSIKATPDDISATVQCFDSLVMVASSTMMGQNIIPTDLSISVNKLRVPNAECALYEIKDILSEIEEAHMRYTELVNALYFPEMRDDDITNEEFHQECEDARKAEMKLGKERASHIFGLSPKEAAKEKGLIQKEISTAAKSYIEFIRRLSNMFKHKRYDKVCEEIKAAEEDHAATVMKALDKVRDCVYLSLVEYCAREVRSMVGATSTCAQKTGVEYDSLVFLTKIMCVQKISLNHKDDGYSPQKLAAISKMMEPMHAACVSMITGGGFISRLESEAQKLASQKITTEDVVEESCKDTSTARKFVSEVRDVAKKYNANFFVVTDGASGYHNGDGGNNPAVKHAREAHTEWEKSNGFDPKEDWGVKTEECEEDGVFTEASLSESLMFQKLNDSSSITKRIADIIRTGSVVERSFIEEQYNQISKTRLSPLVDKVLTAYDHDDIVLIYNKNVHLTAALPFVVMQFKGKFRALIFIADFSSLTKDGTALNIEMKKLYTLMEAALIGLRYYTKPEPFQSSSVIAKLTAAVYAEMGLRILNKEFALTLEKNAYDMVSYSLARFYLTKVLGMTSEEVIDSYSRDTCKSPDNTNMELAKNMYEEEPIDTIEDLLKLFAKLYPKMERLTFRYYLQRWISSYMIGSTLAMDNFPYLYYCMISVLIGSFMINNQALNDPIKNMKGMQHFHGEVARLVV